MSSIWANETKLPAFAPLKGDHSTQVLVIGGGIAGLLCGLMLQRSGVDCTIAEANQICGGVTKDTTAKLTAQHSLIYHTIVRDQGWKQAEQYLRANQRALDEFQRLCQGIDCGFERKDSYVYTLNNKEALQTEQGVLERLEEQIDLPFDTAGALCMPDQAQFHPLVFLKGILPELHIYENTRIQRLEGCTAVASQGRIRAKQVVFCTHFPFVNRHGSYFMKMYQHRSYVLALTGAKLPQGMYVDEQPDGLSFRTAGELLLIGGGDHRTGGQGGGWQELRRVARRYYPGSQEAAHWAAQDCMTLDGVPYIGRYSKGTPNWYVATGFQKWGMTSSMAAAMLISARITGREDPDGAVFSPRRFKLPAAGANLLEDGKQTVKGLSRQLFTSGRAELEALPSGHGGVVELDGEKVGAYRDETGELFLVSTRCPHLGCQLEWNPDEKSWECPCHGSRFDHRGRLLEGPAQTHLTE